MKHGKDYHRGVLDGFLAAHSAPSIVTFALDQLLDVDQTPDLPAPVSAKESLENIPNKANRRATRGSLTEEQKSEISRLFDQGKFIQEIADATGLQYSTVHYRVKNHERRRNPSAAAAIVRRGRKHSNNIWSKPATASPLEVLSEYEENGHTVKVCPPGYAIGAHPQKNVQQYARNKI